MKPSPLSLEMSQKKAIATSTQMFRQKMKCAFDDFLRELYIKLKS